jgi:hypothetical protein
MIIWNSLQAQVLSASGMFTIMDELAPDVDPDGGAGSAHTPPTPDVQIT